MRRAPWILLALTAVACAAPQPLSRESLLARMDALIGTAPCDSDAQCHTIGVGARPCGGPAGYRPWSSAHTDAAQLKSAAEALTAFDRAAQADSGRMSDCRMRPDPGAVCRPAAGGGKRCLLGTANATGRMPPGIQSGLPIVRGF